MSQATWLCRPVWVRTPLRASTRMSARSAFKAPVAMLRVFRSCPGASMAMNSRLSVSKQRYLLARPLISPKWVKRKDPHPVQNYGKRPDVVRRLRAQPDGGGRPVRFSVQPGEAMGHVRGRLIEHADRMGAGSRRGDAGAAMPRSTPHGLPRGASGRRKPIFNCLSRALCRAAAGLLPAVAGQGTGSQCRNAKTAATCRHAKPQNDPRATDGRLYRLSSTTRRLAKLLCRSRPASRFCFSPGPPPTVTAAGFRVCPNSLLPTSVRGLRCRPGESPCERPEHTSGEWVVLPPVHCPTCLVRGWPHALDGGTDNRFRIEFGTG